MAKTLRITVSDDLYFKLGKIKNEFKAEDWPQFMQCVVNEAEWAYIARPVMNQLFEFVRTNQEPELLAKVGLGSGEDLLGPQFKGYLVYNIKEIKAGGFEGITKKLPVD